MARQPNWPVLFYTLFVAQCSSLLADTYFFNVTGNCTNGLYENVYYQPFRTWSSIPRKNNFDCMQYTTLCNDLTMSDHLKDSLNFMGQPHSLDVRVFLKTYPDRITYPGINITWTPPFQGAGISGMKGFLVNIYAIMDNSKQKCRIFDFSQNNFTATDVQLTFNKEFMGFSKKIYIVSVFTLPTSELGERLHLSRYQFVIPQATRKEESEIAADWTAPMTYDNSTLGEVRVGFGLAPAKFGFEKYQLEIIEQGAKNVHQKTIITKAELQDKTWTYYTFTNIPSGLWQVRFQPVDHLFSNYKTCLCYRGYDTVFNHRKCVQCIITETSEFVVGESPMSTTISHSSDVTRVEDYVIKDTETSGTVWKIFGGILGSILVVMLLGWIAYSVRNKRKRVEKAVINSDNDPTNPLDNKYACKETAVSNTIPSVSALPVKTVFITWTDDHKYHNQVVEQFVIYLQTYCKCDVIYAPWYANEIRSLSNGNLWTITNIDKSDYTIIINSEAAFNLFETVKDQNQTHAFKHTDSRPDGDMFTPTIMHIMPKMRQRESFLKFIMASFDYTDDYHVISEIHPQIRYKLPQHMSKLLCHIHSLDTKDVKKSLFEKDLPYGHDITDTPEGSSLVESIRLATDYEQANPRWFNDQFFRMDSGFHSNGPDEMPSPNPYDSISTYSYTDTNSAFTYIPQDTVHNQTNFGLLVADGLEPPENINDFDCLSMTLSDQLRKVNENARLEDEFEGCLRGQTNLDTFDSESIGGKSV